MALICREFHVREEWLRDGTGEMFAPAPSSALDALAEEKGLTHGEYILIEKLLSLPQDVRRGILDYIVEVAHALDADDVSADTPAAPSVQSMTADELHAELDRQIADEKGDGEKSAV